MPEHSLVYPVWSPDGTRLASLCSSEHGEIFITDVSGSTEMLPEPALRGSGAQFSVNSWSPDGRWLAGEETQSDFSASGVLVYSLEQRQYERLTDFGGRPVWLHDSRRLVFFDDGKLYLFDLVSRRHEEIESIGQTELGFFGISPDDGWVYFTRYTNESDIWMMDLD